MHVGNVTVTIPYRASGNALRQENVNFDVSELDSVYTAVPQLDENGRRLANLPPQLQFTISRGQLTSLRGPVDGNRHVLLAIAQKLNLI